MAFSLDKNRNFHERCQNFAKSIQNLREEGARLRAMFLQEVNGSQFFVDTPASTTGEITGIMNYTADFKSFNENAPVGAAPRDSWLLPLVDTTPA